MSLIFSPRMNIKKIVSMKTFLLYIFLLLAVSVSGQTELDFLNALGKENTKNLDSYLSSSVNLGINDKQEEVERSVAIKKIRAFLRANKILKYKILHNGNSSDNKSSYRVARIKSKTGTFRIFAYSEMLNGVSKVVEVRIDEM